MTFSEKLAAAIREKNISLRELSELTGIPKSAIQRYTSGSTEKIPIDRMKRMAEALGIDPAYVMGWDDISTALGPDTPASRKLREIGQALSAAASNPEIDELVDIYMNLNSLGQQTLMGTARGLNANPDMKKAGKSNDETA